MDFYRMNKLTFEIDAFNPFPSDKGILGFRVPEFSTFVLYGSLDHMILDKLKRCCDEIDTLRAEVDFLKERELMFTASQEILVEPE